MLVFFEHTQVRHKELITRNLMVGISAYWETLNGQPFKQQEAIPKKEDIAGIFVNHPLAFNTIHYVDMRGVDVFKNLVRVTEYGGKNLRALQLDMIWPDSTVIKNYREKYPAIQVILQVNTPALNALADIKKDLVSKIVSYGDAINFILLDKSMGKGLGLDANFLRPLVRLLTTKFPFLGLAIAGGLGPESMHYAEPLIGDFKGLSIDAESRLRESGDSLDLVDWNLAKAYLEKALALFSEKSA